jgi:hypothetical protein
MEKIIILLLIFLGWICYRKQENFIAQAPCWANNSCKEDNRPCSTDPLDSICYMRS